MNKSTIHNLIIIGSGPAGLTAGIYAARANLQPIIIAGKNPGGQLMGTSIVENWPGIPSILGPTLMTDMREHTQHAGVTFIEDTVISVNCQQRPFTLQTEQNETLRAHSIIIATGTTPNKLKCPGEETYWGKGVTTCAVCDATLYAGKNVVVVGGGDSAMESASFLRKFTDKITVVHIGNALTASHAMQQRIIHDPAITIIYNSTVTNISGNETHVSQVTITNQQTTQSTTISVDGVFIAIGLTPNSHIFKHSLKLTEHDYIIHTNQTTATSVPGIFAAGDVADSRYRQAITAAGTGCMAALDAEEYLKSII